MIYQFTSLDTIQQQQKPVLGGDDDDDIFALKHAETRKRKLPGQSLVLGLIKAVEADDEDTASVTSQSSCSSCSSVSTSVKSVRFNDDLNCSIDNTQWTKEDCHESWYEAVDYRRFRAHTQALAREVSKAEARNRAPYSYERVILRTYEVCRNVIVEPMSHTVHTVLNAEERKHLRRWAEYAPTRLGLEKWAVKQVGRERTLRRREVVETVLSLQAAGYDTFADPDALAESIRLGAERVSRAGRLFAAAQADAQAAALDSANYFEA